ncbi:MAG: hypothetical protein RR475_07625, partial [Clostridia bacterium]
SRPFNIIISFFIIRLICQRRTASNIKFTRPVLPYEMQEIIYLPSKRYCFEQYPVQCSFGTVKWADGAHYFLCRGKEKVGAEAALAFLSYNLRRAIHLAGTAMLISHFRKKIGAAF